MALYLGSGEKVKVYSNDIAYGFNLFSKIPITNGVRLLSSDDCVLKDSRCVYLTVPPLYILRSLDSYLLKDSNSLYLTSKEDD